MNDLGKQQKFKFFSNKLFLLENYKIQIKSITLCLIGLVFFNLFFSLNSSAKVLNCSQIRLFINKTYDFKYKIPFNFPQTRNEFSDFIQQSFDPNIFLENEFNFLQRKKILSLFSNLPPQYFYLVTDIGVMAHIDKFIDFLNHLKFIGKLPDDPKIAKNYFLKNLGNHIYYRAIALNAMELNVNNLKQQGLYSSLVHNSLSLEKLNNESEISRSEKIKKIWEDVLLKGFKRNINERFGRVKQNPDRLKYNPFLSISEYPDIAVGIAASPFGNDNKNSILLLELNIPKLDVIELNNNDLFHFPWFLNLVLSIKNVNSVIEFNDGKKNYYPYNYHVESMVIYKIEPQEISRAFLIPRENVNLRWRGEFGEKANQNEFSNESYLKSLNDFLVYVN